MATDAAKQPTQTRVAKRPLYVGIAAILVGSLVGGTLGSLLCELISAGFFNLFNSSPPHHTLYVARLLGHVFSGFVAATFARRAKLGHAVAAGVISLLWLGVALLSMGLLRVDGFSWIDWFFVISIVPCAGLGGYLERITIAWFQRLYPRRVWTYETQLGASIRAQAPWNYVVPTHLWRVAGVLFVAFNFLGPTGRAVIDMKTSNDLSQVFTLLLNGLDGFISGIVCWSIAKRMSAQSVDEAQAEDPRPPVVYLRSFEDDGKQLEGEGIGYELADALRAIIRQSKEQRLRKVLSKLGPLVAIGRPGEQLAELGAARMYVSDDDWQAVVEDLVHKSGAVVLQAGQSAGLKWEFSKVIASLDPSRVLLFLPFRLVSARKREAMYQSFLSWAQSCFPVKFPEKIKRSYFIYFLVEPAWTPVLLAPRERHLAPHTLLPVLKRFARDRAFHPSRVLFWIIVVLLLMMFAAVPLISVFIAYLI